MKRRLAPGLVLTSLLLTLASPVWAADDAARGAARKLAESGVEAYQARDYVAASEKLERAYQVVRVPSLALWSARALEKRGKWVEASERYLEATRLDAAVGEVDVQKQARREAEAERQSLLARMPSLAVSLSGATPEQTRVTIDGEPWPSALLGEPRPTNPGEHALRAESAGQVVTLKVTLAEGAQRSETLRFGSTNAAAPHDSSAADSSTTAPGNPRRTLGFVALGVGGAGLLTGIVTGALVASRHSDLEGSCNSSDQCDPARQGDIDSYNSLRTVSSFTLIAGGVLAAAGVTLVLTAPRSTTQAAVVVSPAAVAVRARF